MAQVRYGEMEIDMNVVLYGPGFEMFIHGQWMGTELLMFSTSHHFRLKIVGQILLRQDSVTELRQKWTEVLRLAGSWMLHKRCKRANLSRWRPSNFV